MVQDPAAACPQAQCDRPFRHSRAPFGDSTAGLDRTDPLRCRASTVQPDLSNVVLLVSLSGFISPRLNCLGQAHCAGSRVWRTKGICG